MPHLPTQGNIEYPPGIVPLLQCSKVIKIQFDELVSFHSVSYLSVVSSMRFKYVLFSRKHPQKIGGIVISDKSDLTKIMSP